MPSFLVAQVLLNAGAGEDDDADRQHIEYLIVALERRCLRMFGPIRFEGDLRNLAVVGPAGGDTLGALRRTTVQQDHVQMLGMDLIELVPDQAVIVAVEAAGEGDLRSGG